MTAYDTAALAVPNILRYWPLDETSGTQATEYVASAHGTYVGSPTLNATPGPIMGQASMLTGTAQYVTLPFSGLTSAVSVFGWYIPILGGVGTGLFRDATGGGGWLVSTDPTTGRIGARVNGTDLPVIADQGYYRSGETQVLASARRFIVLTTSGTHARLWIDGELAEEVDITGAASTMASPLNVGRNGTLAQYEFGQYAGYGIVSRVITQEEVRTLYLAGRRPQVERVARPSSFASSTGAHTPTIVPHSRPGDRIVYLVTSKPDTLTAPSATNGYTVAYATTGGTGSQGADTGVVGMWIVAKDAVTRDEAPPTITFTGTGNVVYSVPQVYRPEKGYKWTDAITTTAAWITVASDTNTASPLTGTTGSFANNPTEGDALVVLGSIPSDSGTAVSAITVPVTGLTMVPEASPARVGGSTTGNDAGLIEGSFQILQGTGSSAPAPSVTVTTLTNHSGVIAVVHLRQTPVAAITAIGGESVETDTALPGTTTVNPSQGTRFYLPSTGTPAVVPSTYATVWDDTAGTIVRPLVAGTPSNTALSSTSRAQAVTTNSYDVLLGAFVSEPLGAQTISGYFNMNIGVAESNTSLNGFTQVAVRLIDSSGAERSVLYSGTTATNSSGTAGDNALEWAVSSTIFTGRRFTALLTSQTATAGDRLVVEIGFRNNETSATSFTGFLRVGDPTAGSDIAWADSQATTANRTYVTFQSDLFPATIPATGTGSLSLSASGTHSSVATASLSLSGSGTWSTSGSASLDLSGSGSVTSPSSASASLSFSATGDAGVLSMAADGTASLDLSAVGSGQASNSGTASLNLSASGNLLTGTASLSLSASGDVTAPQSGTAALDLSGTGNASLARSGTGSLSLSSTGLAKAASARSGTASITFASGPNRAGVARSGTASITVSAAGIIAARSGTASLTLTMPPRSIVAPGVVTTQGVGQITLLDEVLVFAPDMSLTLESYTIERAPSALRVILTGGQAQTDVVFDIDGTDVLTVSANSEGSLSQTQINVNTTLGTAGVHTLTATQVATTGTITASVDFTVLYAPLVYPPPPTPNTPPVVVPDAVSTIDNTQHWVLQDLLAEIDGGIGTYVFPHNPREMTSPHYEYAMSSTHSTASDGKVHVFQAGNMPKEWVFKGYCPTQEHQEAITAYRNLNRRFWIIDHRNRAWVVMFTDAQFVPHLRQNYNGVDTDWGSDFTVTAAVFDQDYSVPS